MRKIGLVAAFVVVFSSACEQAGDDASSQEPMEGATVDHDATGAHVDRANEAIRALQAGLVGALTSEMKAGGPSSAVYVCRDEAQAITAKVSRENGIEVGRTSHRLRNPENAPRPWAEDVVRESAGRKTSDVGPHVVDLGDRIGVLKPINTLGLCTNCHGNPGAIAAEVKQALVEAYPEDKAVGFAVGDLRGWMWAEVPKKPNKK